MEVLKIGVNCYFFHFVKVHMLLLFLYLLTVFASLKCLFNILDYLTFTEWIVCLKLTKHFIKYSLINFWTSNVSHLIFSTMHAEHTTNASTNLRKPQAENKMQKSTEMITTWCHTGNAELCQHLTKMLKDKKLQLHNANFFKVGI